MINYVVMIHYVLIILNVVMKVDNALYQVRKIYVHMIINVVYHVNMIQQFVILIVNVLSLNVGINGDNVK